jgi:hypothetical protein
MKFLKIKPRLKQAGKFLQQNIPNLTPEKKQLIAEYTWYGIIPNNLPKHLQPFKKQLQQLATTGSPGPAWDKLIKETREFIEEAKNMDTSCAKWEKYLTQLKDVNYKDQDNQNEKEKLFNLKVRNKITETQNLIKAKKKFDISFFENKVLPDIEHSKVQAFLKHFAKYE